MQRIREELKKLEENGQLRKIPEIANKEGNKILIDNIEYINFASNDYLGISTNLDLKNEFLASNNSLMSSASARLLSGTSKEFLELESTIKELFQKEGCLIFNTGYQCNLGVISALCEKGDVIFSDKLNHASIIDGMRLADGEFIRYRHLDYEHLEELLKSKRSNFNRAIIVSESVFSMDGDIADIEQLIKLKNKYNCLLMIDEAHAFCASGPNLTGFAQHSDVDIITATFGKALASFGAFCVANNDIINYLVNKSRSFIFSTSIPPINIAWTNWLLTTKLEYIKQQKSKLNKLAEQAHKLIGKTVSKSHIIPIIIGSNEDTLIVTEQLKANGYYVPAIRPPTVPIGTSRLRLSITAETSINDIEAVIKIARESLS